MTDSAPAPALDPTARRILQAAALRFAAEGFERTKLADVARDAGLAVGTIYLRHDGKTALLAAVLTQAEERYAAAMDTPALWATPWPARFRAVFEAVFRTVAEDTVGQRLMPLAPFAQAAGWRQGDGIRPVIRRHIAEGQAAGVLRPDINVAMAAAIAFGMVEGAMSEVMSNPAAPVGTAVDHLAGAAEAWLCRRP